MEYEAPEYYKKLVDALQALRDAKPQDRSELARAFAVVITDMEKVVACASVYLVNYNPSVD